MVRDLDTYRLVRVFAVRDVDGMAARCDHCDKRILDYGSFSVDRAIQQQARHGDVILDDTVYVVRGPSGERQVCLPCYTRGGFKGRDAGTPDNS